MRAIARAHRFHESRHTPTIEHLVLVQSKHGADGPARGRRVNKHGAWPRPTARPERRAVPARRSGPAAASTGSSGSTRCRSS